MMCDVFDVFRILEAQAYQANELLLTTFLKISAQAVATSTCPDSREPGRVSSVACGQHVARSQLRMLHNIEHNGCVSLQNETK